MFSLEDLDVVKACGIPFEFELMLGGEQAELDGRTYWKGGSPSGVFLKVLGDESETVAKETAAFMAAERARQAVLGSEYQQDNVTLGKKLAALRVVGWRGIKQEYSRENAIALCMSGLSYANQVLLHSRQLSNFIKL
jgi:hypothetical protein